MFFAFTSEPLELRAGEGGSRHLVGRFPYNKVAVLSDGGRTGRPRKEKFAPRAFSHTVNDTTADVHLLVGHSFDQPLASRATNTLTLHDSDAALTFSAIITSQVADTSYGADILKLIAAGLAIGLSPGFRIPPKRAVANPEQITDEGHDPANGKYNAIIRTILAAILFELSIVTRPAYSDSQVESRNWQIDETSGLARPNALARWRL